MNFNDAQKAAYGRVIVAMPDPVPGYNREWNEQAEADRKAEAERNLRVKDLSDHLFKAGFEYRDMIDALSEADQENAAILVKLIRSDDDAELGRMVKALIHAYSFRVAEIKA